MGQSHFIPFKRSSECVLPSETKFIKNEQRVVEIQCSQSLTVQFLGNPHFSDPPPALHVPSATTYQHWSGPQEIRRTKILSTRSFARTPWSVVSPRLHSQFDFSGLALTFQRKLCAIFPGRQPLWLSPRQPLPRTPFSRVTQPFSFALTQLYSSMVGTPTFHSSPALCT